jgi:Protein of unknown function (DUF3558)
MGRRRLCAALIGCVVALATVSCSTNVNGRPQGSATSSAAGGDGSARSPEHGAPRVRDPLNAAPFLKSPCSVLTEKQVGELFGAADAVKGQPVRAGSTDPACDWDDSSGVIGAFVSTLFLTANHGLSGIYAQKGKKLKFFQEIDPIEGYPAVLSDEIDLRSRGLCIVDVGISDELALTVQVDLRGGSNAAPNFHNPCGVAETSAANMVSTMKSAT